MKTLARSIQFLSCLALVVALPRAASAAKVFASMSALPISTNITVGVATNVSSTISLVDGSGGSSVGSGSNCFFSVSISPSDPTVTTTLNPTNFVSVKGGTQMTVLTVSTTAATPSNTYVVTIWANSNPSNSVAITPISATYTITMQPGGPFNPLKVWTPGGVNGNWSTTGNWSPAGAPVSSNDVKFFDPGAVGTPGATDNTVNSSFVIGSLTYGQTNNAHTTLISPGLTLTVIDTNGLSAGTGTDNGNGQVTSNTITGATGTLIVSNLNANVFVGQGSSSANGFQSATLDMSGLGTFQATIGRLAIGQDSTIKQNNGVLNLAATNVITTAAGAAAPQVDVGDNTSANAISSIVLEALQLGQTNAIYADSIEVGRGRSLTSTMRFNPAFVSPSALFRGTNGNTSRVTTWYVADGNDGKVGGFTCYATNDFSDGTVDAMVDTMYLGFGSTAVSLNAITGQGTLIMGAGNINVNTLEVGYTNAGPGTGIVTLNGGTLLVNTNLELAHGGSAAGTLNLLGGTLNAASITAGGGSANISLGGGALIVTNSMPAVATTENPLSSLNVTGSAITVPVQYGVPAISTANLSVSSPATTINISFVPLLTGFPTEFTVIQYGLNGGSASGDLTQFTVGSLPAASTNYSAFISNNVANNSIDIVFTAGPTVPALTWDGRANADWDMTSTNWRPASGPDTAYSDPAFVTFNDTLTGTNGVDLTTVLTPGRITVANSGEDYTFSGVGRITGSAALTKSGSRNLILTESGGDNYTGGVTVNGGTLQVGAGGTSGNLPSASVTIGTGANVDYDRSDNVTVASPLSGTGTLVQSGLSILGLTGANGSFLGQMVVSNGTLQAGNTSALGAVSATVVVNSPGTLDVNGQSFNNDQPVTATGAGVGGNGAIVNNSTNSPAQILRNVTLGGNTTFGGIGDWDIHSSGNAAEDASLSTQANPYTVTKVGTNTVTVFGAVVDGALGDINIQAGAMSFERNTTGLGDPTHTITVFTNASLQIANASNVWSKFVVLQNGGTFQAVNFDEFNGAVTLQSGTGTLTAGNGATLKLDSAVGGAGGLTKAGSGEVILTSASTYSGTTLISGGTLSLTASGSIDSSTNITITAGDTLDLSTLSSPTLTRPSGTTLNGSGTVNGNVTMASGSTLSIGGPGTNIFGTLIVTNTLTLQGGSTTVALVGKVGASPFASEAVATNVNYGGTLTVNGGGGAFAAGDTFKLFAAGSIGGSFTAVNLPAGITWDTSNLGVNGTIKVVSVSKPHIATFAPTNGVFGLSFTGPGGNTYRVFASTNVAATPVASAWSVVGTGVINSSLGIGTFVDTNSPGIPARFYLISVP